MCRSRHAQRFSACAFLALVSSVVLVVLLPSEVVVGRTLMGDKNGDKYEPMASYGAILTSTDCKQKHVGKYKAYTLAECFQKCYTRDCFAFLYRSLPGDNGDNDGGNLCKLYDECDYEEGKFGDFIITVKFPSPGTPSSTTTPTPTPTTPTATPTATATATPTTPTATPTATATPPPTATPIPATPVPT